MWCEYICALSDSNSLVNKLLVIHIFATFRVYDNQSLEQCRLCTAMFWRNADWSLYLLPHKIMEQNTLCDAKLCSNADFATQNYVAMQTLPCESTET